MNRRNFITAAALIPFMPKIALAQMVDDGAVCSIMNDVDFCTPKMLRTIGPDSNGDNFSIVYIERFGLSSLSENNSEAEGRERFLSDEFLYEWAERTKGLVQYADIPDFIFGWNDATHMYGQQGSVVTDIPLREGEFRVLEGTSSQDIPTEFHDGPKHITTFFIHDGWFAYIITICFQNEETDLLLELFGSGQADVHTITIDLETYKVVHPNEYPQLWRAP